MDKGLQLLAGWFKAQGLGVESIPKEETAAKWHDQLMVCIPGDLNNYGFTVLTGVENVFSITIWEAYTGGTIGEFWSNNYKEILSLSLLKIVSWDTQHQ